MEMVGKFESKEDAENGYNIMKDILKTYPEVKGVESSDSVEIQGIARAIEEGGLVDEIHVIGICIVSDVGDLIKSGAIDLSMLWDPADAAYAANVLGYKLLNGEEITDGMDLGVPGWESIKIVEGVNGVPVIYGQAFAKINADNMDQFDF
jgi:simple sugar transport system substrate-binding protein